MTAYVALLRAVNVGGTGKLPMSNLKAMCEETGLRRVRTYIASGNVVFESDGAEAAIREILETRLARFTGKPVGVFIRTAAQMARVVATNTFPGAPGNRVMATFLDAAPTEAMLSSVAGQADEQLRLGQRELYVWYPDGMGQSKLRIAAAAAGTARNMNTVATLAAMAGEG